MSTPVDPLDSAAPPKKKLGPAAIAIIAVSAMALLAIVIFIVQTLLTTVTDPLQSDEADPTTTITEQVEPGASITLAPAP